MESGFDAVKAYTGVQVVGKLSMWQMFYGHKCEGFDYVGSNRKPFPAQGRYILSCEEDAVLMGMDSADETIFMCTTVHEKYEKRDVQWSRGDAVLSVRTGPVAKGHNSTPSWAELEDRHNEQKRERRQHKSVYEANNRIIEVDVSALYALFGTDDAEVPTRSLMTALAGAGTIQ